VPSAPKGRFGIGEWYGRPFAGLTPAERKAFAEIQRVPYAQRPPQPCPFQSTVSVSVPCTKNSGVCSIRLYMRDNNTGAVKVADPPHGRLRCLCPNRFAEAGTVFKWVAQTILHCDNPIVLNEIPFLKSTVPGVTKSEGVGKIDNILVVPDTQPLEWCAVEVQAVYFSGFAMKNEFEVIASHDGPDILFPAAHRRPDYRSSGPKRLMPQLQIKVPSLSRWGKKMAVVVDQDFFENMGRMEYANDLTNSDVAWFIMRFEESAGLLRLLPHEVRLTTLANSVLGLTGGDPVSKTVFEQTMQAKLAALGIQPAQITPNQ